MIYINNLKKEIGARTLFEIDKLSINEYDKIGLIGDNGVGKTTLLKILANLDSEYSGYIDVKTHIDFIFNDKVTENNLDILNNMNRYSPGEFQKIRLTEVLKNESSFLLIDEPTSHLDIKQKELLIENLDNRYKGYIIISHDRDFIDKTCGIIFELSQSRLNIYNGNYSFYLEEKIKREKNLKREYENYISEKNRLLRVARDIKNQSSNVKTSPKRMGNSEARLHKMGGQSNKKKLDNQVKSIESRIDHLEVKEKPKEEVKIELTIPDRDKIFSKVLVSQDNLNKKFKENVIFNNTKLEIQNYKRIALIGENGSGKTTLLNMIIDREVWVHPNIKIGYYSQLGEIVDYEKTILENIIESSIYNQTMTRIILARLGFKTDEVYKKVNILSDGERAKVKLAKLLTSDFNFLIMDEPTNFLDIRAIDALEELLKNYDRPMLFVTHDISFINNIADEILIIKNQKIIEFDGNYEEYQRTEENNTAKNTDDMLIDFRLTAINNRLASDIPNVEREELLIEYKKLINLKNKKNM